MSSKYFFFIFKYSFRKRALNNFLKIKNIKNIKILNLSGTIRYYLLGLPLYFIVSRFKVFFKNVVLISCDGRPQIKYNGINLWFGGTSYKVPKEFAKFQNNCFVFENFSKKEKNLLNLYPFKPLSNPISKKQKLVFIGEFGIQEDKILDEIWANEKNKILKKLSLLDTYFFWEKYNLQKHERFQYFYLQLKERLRLDIIIEISKKFNDQFLLIGSKWQKFIPIAQPDEFNVSTISDYYNNNICLDFGSKWGSNIIYPRSVEIIEQGGLLLQAKQINESDKLYDTDIINNFNSFDELVSKIMIFLKDDEIFKKKLEKQNNFFKNSELNYPTLLKIYEISKKNNF